MRYVPRGVFYSFRYLLIMTENRLKLPYIMPKNDQNDVDFKFEDFVKIDKPFFNFLVHFE